MGEGLVWGDDEFEIGIVLSGVTFGIEGIVNPLLMEGI
jgi:hypothetical protein